MISQLRLLSQLQMPSKNSVCSYENLYLMFTGCLSVCLLVLYFVCVVLREQNIGIYIYIYIRDDFHILKYL